MKDKCPKCGGEILIRYDGSNDELMCKCRRCEYNFRQEPLDSPTPHSEEKEV